MSFGNSILLLSCIVITLLPSIALLQDDVNRPHPEGKKWADPDGQDQFFKVKLEGWVNPDDIFQHEQSLDTQQNTCTECRKDLKVWLGKFSECENALQRALSLKKNKEKEHLSTVSKPQNTLQCSGEDMGAATYLRRFIHMILEAIDVKSENEVDLRLYITEEERQILRQFAHGEKSKRIPFRKIDEIFANMFAKHYSFLPDLSGFVASLFVTFELSSFFVTVLIPAFSFFCVLMWTRSPLKSFVWIVAVAFLVSFLTTASLMYKEASLKQYEEMKKSGNQMPPDCMGERSWWEHFRGSPKESDCSKYLKAHFKDPNLDITAFRIITRMFGIFVVDGMAHFGDGSLKFLDNFKDLTLFNWALVVPIACLLFIVVLLILSAALSGGSFRLPLFMGSFNFHNSRATARIADDEKKSESMQSSLLDIPVASNRSIIFNFNSPLPSNVHEVCQSVLQALPLTDQVAAGSSSETSDAYGNSMFLPTMGARELPIYDTFAAGDGHASAGPRKTHLRPSYVCGVKKTHTSRQFTQLEARHKAPHKCGKSKPRERHKSL